MTVVHTTGVVKVIEVVGMSEKSWSDAARHAVEVASETVHYITGLYVLRSTAKVVDGKITEYRVDAKIAFLV